MVFFLLFLRAVLSDNPVVSDNDILMTRQGYGECRRDLSVEGNPLKINGVTFPDGIGSHATSMIPISVPTDGYTLKGAVGIDDEVKGTGTGTVVFRILSGSEVIWDSGVVKSGEAAKSFSVKAPTGAKKLYLLADEYDNNSFDHADWVNLRWERQARVSNLNMNKKVIRAVDYGLKSNAFEDQGPALRKMISVARRNPGSTILLEKGDYHFYASGALKMTFSISNHDQPTFHPICVPLIDLVNVTLDCSNSTFYFHNEVEPFLIMDSFGVTVNNLHIDYYRPYYTEAIVKSADFFSTTFRINKTLYPYHVSNGQFVFENEDFTTGANSFMLFDGKTKHILPGTSDVGCSGTVTDNSDGTVTMNINLHRYNLKEGDCAVIRSWGRPQPAIVIYRATNTHLNFVNIHCSQGMALLAQRSDTIYMNYSGINVATESRYYSASADATHFSNVKGNIVVENGLFEGMMDDAINVHSTSLSITQIVNSSCIKLKYMHGQSVGFETFLPGENVQFIKAQTMELSEKKKVTRVRKLSTTEIYVSFEGSIPSDIRVGDSVENGDYYPSVVFRGNLIRNNRARGSLFTTPKSVLVENNNFDYTSGSALLLAGDAANWYESGACTDVVIRNNKFVNSLTSTYQFTEAIIAIYPTIGDVKNQKVFYHRNVKIENNIFETFDLPLLFAISTQNLYFRNNEINYNNDFASWGKLAFHFNKVENVVIAGNKVSPSKTFTISDVTLENTDKDQIHFE